MSQKIWINLEKKRLVALRLKMIIERKQGFFLETLSILDQEHEVLLQVRTIKIPTFNKNITKLCSTVNLKL